MSAVTDLRALLAADAGVASLVGARISADRIEQSYARPFIVFVRSATERVRGLDGSLLGSRVTFEIQCWADGRIAAEAVADAVQACLESAHHHEVARNALSEPDLDLEAETLTFDWWE